MPDSSANRNNTTSGPSPVLRASRRRQIDNGNETAFWASDRGAASQSPLPPATSTTATDRPQHPRRYAEDDDQAEDLPRNGSVSFGRRNSSQEKELSQRRPDPATIAPHSSGALFPRRGGAPGVGLRIGVSDEAAGAPKWWREGGNRAAAPAVQRAGFLGGKEEHGFGSGRRRMEWDPYPDMSYGDEDDDEQEPTEHVSESRGVYKSARSKRRMSRSRRARAAAKGSSLGDRRRPGTGLDGGWAGDDVAGGSTGGFS